MQRHDVRDRRTGRWMERRQQTVLSGTGLSGTRAAPRRSRRRSAAGLTTLRRVAPDGVSSARAAYKDIDAVMAAQTDLVEPLARFERCPVKVAPGGEPAED